MRQFVTCCVFLGAFVGTSAALADESTDVVAARMRLAESYASRLAELATWCDREKLAQEAQRTRNWSVPRKHDRLYLWLLPVNRLGDELAPGDRRWQERFAKLRRGQADALFALVRSAIDAHRVSLASELLLETAHENPDHEEARRLLGYTDFRGSWRTPFEMRQLTAGKVWHAKWGWLPEAHIARYDRGERYYRGRWLSAEEESRLRSDLRRGWRVESEHYVVTTNHSLEEGVRLASQLERLYGFWQNIFARYAIGEKELVRRLAGSSADRAAASAKLPKKHNVVQYRTRQQYNDALRAAQPKIDMTLGIYFDKTQTAHFFAGQDQEPGTIYHEATHQLFQEARPTARQVGRDRNFWIIEAIACYMESLEDHGGYYTVGGMDTGRLPAARQRLLADRFYLPLADLIRLSMSELQTSPEIGMLYSQASGLAAFLMHYDLGRYREALGDYLVAVYSGRDQIDTLPELCGTSSTELDRQYRLFLEDGGLRVDRREARGIGKEPKSVQ